MQLYFIRSLVRRASERTNTNRLDGSAAQPLVVLAASSSFLPPNLYFRPTSLAQLHLYPLDSLRARPSASPVSFHRPHVCLASAGARHTLGQPTVDRPARLGLSTPAASNAFGRRPCRVFGHPFELLYRRKLREST